MQSETVDDTDDIEDRNVEMKFVTLYVVFMRSRNTIAVIKTSDSFSNSDTNRSINSILPNTV